MKTITDIKKALAVGSFWHCTNHNPAAVKPDMGVREVGANTATQFAFKNDDSDQLSYCGWPKKGEVTFSEDGNAFTILLDGKPALTYTKAEKPAPEADKGEAGKPEGEPEPGPKAEGWDEQLPATTENQPSVKVLSSGVKVKTLAVITNPPRTLVDLEQDIKRNLQTIANSALRIGGLLALGREFHASQAEFLTWADKQFSLGKAQVYKLMKIHQEFGEDARFKGVAMRVMAQLSGAPEPVKEKAAQLAEAGKLDSKAAEALTQKPTVIDQTGAAQAPLTIEQLDGITTVNPVESGAEGPAPFDTGEASPAPKSAPEGGKVEQEAVILDAPKGSETEKLLAKINELMEQNGKLQEQLAALNKPKARAAVAAPMLKQFKHADPCIVLGLSQEEGKSKKDVKGAVRELSAIWNADTNAEAWALITKAQDELLKEAK